MNTLKFLRPNDNIVLYNEPLHTKDDVGNFTVEFTERDKNTIFIVTDHSESIVDKILLEEVDKDKSGYIFFNSELYVDPINNCMVPKHRKATREEIKKYLINNHIKLSSLPVLKMTDPIRRWHNFNKGSIIIIERKEEIYFRRVDL